MFFLQKRTTHHFLYVNNKIINNLNTPILYIVFNRPDLVKKSLAKIKEASPKKLYIAADGPRASQSTDSENCFEVRRLVKEMVDWDCTVKYLFRENNLGCGMAVSSAISWFFENELEGIILEDDCIPDLSFFKFCEELLERYRDSIDIFQIAGSNWQQGIKRGHAHYYFSNISSVWGWATWKSRWDLYNYEIDVKGVKYKKVEQNLKQISSSNSEVNYHMNCFKRTANGEIDTWDYQWRYLVLLNKGKSIVPNYNLVTNIGFGEDGTHTFDVNHWRSKLKSKSLRFPLKHPKEIKISKKADAFLAKKIWLSNKYSDQGFLIILRKVLKKIKHRLYG